MCQTLRSLEIVSHLILKRTLWGRYCYFQYFVQHVVNKNFNFSVFIIALNRTQCRSVLAKFQKSEHIHETPMSTVNYCCPSDFKRAWFLTFPCSATKASHVWLCDPVDFTVHWILQARGGIEPRFPSLREDSLPAEAPGKPKNGVGSLFHLQGIFLTQESNGDLLHCKRILY